MVLTVHRILILILHLASLDLPVVLQVPGVLEAQEETLTIQITLTSSKIASRLLEVLDSFHLSHKLFQARLRLVLSLRATPRDSPREIKPLLRPLLKAFRQVMLRDSFKVYHSLKTMHKSSPRQAHNRQYLQEYLQPTAHPKATLLNRQYLQEYLQPTAHLKATLLKQVPFKLTLRCLQDRYQACSRAALLSQSKICHKTTVI